MPKPKLPPPAEQITLIVPTGTQRSARVVLPREVATWLLVQLTIALGPQEEQAR